MIGSEKSPLLEIGRKNIVACKLHLGREVEHGEECGQNVDLRAHLANSLWLDASRAEDEAGDVIFLQR